MAAIVRLRDGTVARVECGIWTSDHAWVVSLLELVRPPASGSDPDPDLTAAQAVVDAYGGEIIQQAPPWCPPDGLPA